MVDLYIGNWIVTLEVFPLRGMWLSIAEGGEERGICGDADAGLWFSLKGPAGEAMVQEPSERKEQVILKIDASQPSHQPKT